MSKANYRKKENSGFHCFLEKVLNILRVQQPIAA